MTRAEFDAWIEQHYTELLGVARRRVRRDAEDVVQQAVAGMLASLELQRRPVVMAWPWAVLLVRRVASDRRRKGSRHAKKTQTSGVLLAREKKMPRLSSMQKGTQAADNYGLERLEENRVDFDMDGYGRTTRLSDPRGTGDDGTKLDPHAHVRFPFEDEA